jgi:hypothetical protein
MGDNSRETLLTKIKTWLLLFSFFEKVKKRFVEIYDNDLYI